MRGSKEYTASRDNVDRECVQYINALTYFGVKLAINITLKVDDANKGIQENKEQGHAIQQTVLQTQGKALEIYEGVGRIEEQGREIQRTVMQYRSNSIGIISDLPS